MLAACPSCTPPPPLPVCTPRRRSSMATSPKHFSVHCYPPREQTTSCLWVHSSHTPMHCGVHKSFKHRILCRCRYINPAGSAVREGLLWTTNTDGPAGGSNSLLVGVWNAVNRPIQGGGKNGIPEVRGNMS